MSDPFVRITIDGLNIEMHRIQNSVERGDSEVRLELKGRTGGVEIRLTEAQAMEFTIWMLRAAHEAET